MVENLNKILQNVLITNAKTRITYTGQKLGSRFYIKDKSNETRKHDLIQFAKCPKPSCTEDYLSETGRRIPRQTANHAGNEKQSHLLNYVLTRNHRHVDL